MMVTTYLLPDKFRYVIELSTNLEVSMVRSMAMCFALAAAITAAPVSAQGLSRVEVGGRATIGPAVRDVVVRFSCALDQTNGRQRVNNLAVELDVPAVPDLAKIFNFDKLDGPGAMGVKEHLTAAGQIKVEMDFSGSGSTGSNFAPATTFTFSAGMTPSSGANYRNLQSVVRALSAGQGSLNYTVANPARSGLPLQAQFALTESDAGRIQNSMRECLISR